MPLSERVRAVARNPAAVCALAAVMLRLALLVVAWNDNPLVRYPQLDGTYYLYWAQRIVEGDWFAGGPVLAGTLPAETASLPYFLNPLPAYVAAFFQALAGFDGGSLLLRVFQCVLAGGTTAFAAKTAERLFGAVAAWTAGGMCAFSAVLVQLDLHVSVSALASFLVAGAMWSTLPVGPEEHGPAAWLRGPVATGVWLGAGALARPVTMFALPFVAWLYASRASDGRRLRAAAVCTLGFVLAVMPSPMRNLAVSGEPVLFTAASGANLYLGNNAATRQYRTMSSNDRFRFNPFEMHRDARRYMSERIGPDASWGEISNRFTRDGIDEFFRAPGASALFYLQKARWFLGPEEVPSSASLAVDREFVPALHIAFVPTWLIAVLGLTGFLLFVRRRDVVLGPGGLALAHGIVLTIVFPLSHYRSPAVPALAVLAGGAVAVLAGLFVRGRVTAESATEIRLKRRRRLTATGIAAMCVLAAWIPPRAAPMFHNGLMTAAAAAEQRGDWAEAERFSQRALAVHQAAWPAEPELAFCWFTLARVAFFQGDFEGAVRNGRKALALEPRDWVGRLTVCMALFHMNRPNELLAEIDQAVALEVDYDLRLHPAIRARYAEAYFLLGKMDEARVHARYALERAREARDRPLEVVVTSLFGR